LKGRAADIRLLLHLGPRAPQSVRAGHSCRRERPRPPCGWCARAERRRKRVGGACALTAEDAGPHRCVGQVEHACPEPGVPAGKPAGGARMHRCTPQTTTWRRGARAADVRTAGGRHSGTGRRVRPPPRYGPGPGTEHVHTDASPQQTPAQRGRRMGRGTFRQRRQRASAAARSRSVARSLHRTAWSPPS